MADLGSIRLYRLTHIENIPHILEHGITHASSDKANPNYFPIGDRSIIKARTSKSVQVAEKMIGDYIPFYFSYRTPMLFVVQYGLNGVNQVFPEDLVYCVTSVQKLIDSGNDFVFSNGHGNNNLTDFFKADQIENLEEIVDFRAVGEPNWKDEYDTDLKRRKDAEFLIVGDLNPEIISGYVVYNQEALRKLIQWGVPENMVVFRENYYFPR